MATKGAQSIQNTCTASNNVVDVGIVSVRLYVAGPSHIYRARQTSHLQCPHNRLSSCLSYSAVSLCPTSTVNGKAVE